MRDIIGDQVEWSVWQVISLGTSLTLATYDLSSFISFILCLLLPLAGAGTGAGRGGAGAGSDDSDGGVGGVVWWRRWRQLQKPSPAPQTPLLLSNWWLEQIRASSRRSQDRQTDREGRTKSELDLDLVWPRPPWMAVERDSEKS